VDLELFGLVLPDNIHQPILLIYKRKDMRISNVAYGGEGKVTWNILNDDIIPPVNTVAPVVSADGNFSFTTTDGTWDQGFPGIVGFSYQWQRFSSGSWTNVSGEIYQTYICRDADNGTNVRCAVGAVHHSGTVSATSNQSSGITGANVFVIAAGMVILYADNYTGPIDGWELYTTGVDKLIAGADDSVNLEGTTTSQSGLSNSASFGTIAYGGNHLGGNIIGVFNSSGGYSPRNYINYNGVAGQHLHTGANCLPATGLSTAMKPRHNKFTLLTNPSSANFLPAGSVQMNEDNVWTDGTAFYVPLDETGNGRAAFVCGSNKSEYLPASASTHTFTWTVGIHPGIASYHGHSSPGPSSVGHPTTTMNGNYGIAEYVDNTAYQSTYPIINTTGHIHTQTRSVAISNMTGKLLKFWKIKGRSIPKGNAVMMHTSKSSLSGSIWAYCNGTNSTIDMRGQLLAIPDEGWVTRYPQAPAPAGYPAHGAPTFATNPIDYTLTNPAVTASANWPHYHATFRTIANAPKGVDYFGHQTENIIHSHSISGGTLTSNYYPGVVFLSFVRYIGPQ